MDGVALNSVLFFRKCQKYKYDLEITALGHLRVQEWVLENPT